MVKAQIKSIRPSADAQAYKILVEFPEFPAPGGIHQMLVFKATLEEYQAWTPPDGVDKTPSNFIEYTFIRPAYEKLENISSALKPLVDKEYDW